MARQPGNRDTEKSPHPFTRRIGIISIIIGITGALATAWQAWVASNSPKPQVSSFLVTVYGKEPGKQPVSDARVSLEVPGVMPEYTDSQGQAVLQITKDSVGGRARLSISKDGFESYSEYIVITRSFYRVYLHERPDGQVSAHSTPPGPISTTGANSPIVTGNGNALSYGSDGSTWKPKQK